MIILAMLFIGCTQSEPVVYLSAPSHRIDAHTIADYYTPSELDLIVRRWAKEREIQFDFSDLNAHVVVPQDREHLVTVWYGGGIGKRFLEVKLNEYAEVIEHNVAIGVCGIEE